MRARLLELFLISSLAALLLGANGCALFKPSSTDLLSNDVARPQLSASVSDLSAKKQPAAPAAAPARPAQQLTASDSAQPAYRLRQGDPVMISLRGIMPRDEDIQTIVDEDGYVKLTYIDRVMALGKSASELERDIQRTYIERGIYRSISVNVIVPSQAFFVQGEVRVPQRYALITGMTMIQAIAAAGGYTEFADPKRVVLTRGGVVRTVNMRDIERNPTQDFMIESGDVIRVPRSIF